MLQIGTSPSVYGAARALKKHAGAAKRQTTFDGLQLKIEYDPGEIRAGVNKKTGEKWERKMHASYGYIPRTNGHDGEAVDIYLAKDPKPGAPVVVVHQVKEDGSRDEDKVMLGFESPEAAKAMYLQHVPKHCFGSMTVMDRGELDEYLEGVSKEAGFKQKLIPAALAALLMGGGGAPAKAGLRVASRAKPVPAKKIPLAPKMKQPPRRHLFRHSVDDLQRNENAPIIGPSFGAGRGLPARPLRTPSRGAFGLVEYRTPDPEIMGKIDKVMTPRIDKIAAAAREVLKGGLADHMPDKAFAAGQLARGARVEGEHTSSPAKAREIAKDHLAEDPKYYEKLKRIEKAAGELARAAGGRRRPAAAGARRQENFLRIKVAGLGALARRAAETARELPRRGPKTHPVARVLGSPAVKGVTSAVATGLTGAHLPWVLMAGVGRAAGRAGGLREKSTSLLARMTREGGKTLTPTEREVISRLSGMSPERVAKAADELRRKTGRSAAEGSAADKLSLLSSSKWNPKARIDRAIDAKVIEDRVARGKGEYADGVMVDELRSADRRRRVRKAVPYIAAGGAAGAAGLALRSRGEAKKKADQEVGRGRRIDGR